MALLSKKQRVLQKSIFMSIDFSNYFKLDKPYQPQVPLCDYTEDHILSVISRLNLILRQFDNMVRVKGNCRSCQKAHKIIAKQEMEVVLKAMGKQICLILGVDYENLFREIVEETMSGKKARSRTLGPRDGIKILNNDMTSPLLPNAAHDRSSL